MDGRMAYLIEKAADALDDGRDPFSAGFLVDHDVTADECFDLSNAMAGACRTLLLLMESSRARKRPHA